MSNEDTPRTEAGMWSAPVNWSHSKEFVEAELSRQLERELNAANERVRKAEQERDGWKYNEDIARENCRKIVGELRDARAAAEHNGELAKKAESDLAKLAAENAELRKDRERHLEVLGECASLFDEMDSIGWHEDSDFTSSSYSGIADEVNKCLELAAMQSEQPRGEQS